MRKFLLVLIFVKTCINSSDVDSILKRSQKTEVQEQIKIKSKDIDLIMKEMEV